MDFYANLLADATRAVAAHPDSAFALDFGDDTAVSVARRDGDVLVAATVAGVRARDLVFDPADVHTEAVSTGLKALLKALVAAERRRGPSTPASVTIVVRGPPGVPIERHTRALIRPLGLVATSDDFAAPLGMVADGIRVRQLAHHAAQQAAQQTAVMGGVIARLKAVLRHAPAHAHSGSRPSRRTHDARRQGRRASRTRHP
jgi:hypothetical protein